MERVPYNESVKMNSEYGRKELCEERDENTIDRCELVSDALFPKDFRPKNNR